jgi:hypothetical protein
MHPRILSILALAFLLLLPACFSVQYGLPLPGYGYPSALRAVALRTGGTANFIYYPRYEAYYHPSTQMFYYLNGSKWEVKPTVLSSTAKEIRATPSVPFEFPGHPSKYHEMVKQAYPPTWTTAKGRYDEPYPFGHSGYDLDRR